MRSAQQCRPFTLEEESRVRVPSVEEEDRKRLVRERQRLVRERTSLTNTIKGLLTLHGVFCRAPRRRPPRRAALGRAAEDRR